MWKANLTAATLQTVLENNMASPLEAAQAAVAQMDEKIEGQKNLVANTRNEFNNAQERLKAMMQERSRWQRAVIVLKQARV